jgi:hypothetical protein
MVSHLSSHLDYKPITCQHCNTNFSNEVEFQHHGKQHKDLETIKYVLTRHHYLDRWIDKLSVALNDVEQLNHEFIDCCPVCRTLYERRYLTRSSVTNESLLACKVEPGSSSSRDSFQIYRFDTTKCAQIRHVYDHLCYHPYRCRLCFDANETVCFTLLDTSCLTHLKKHNIRHICATNIDNFVERLSITLIDDLFDAHKLNDVNFRRINCNRCDRDN